MVPEAMSSSVCLQPQHTVQFFRCWRAGAWLPGAMDEMLMALPCRVGVHPKPWRVSPGGLHTLILTYEVAALQIRSCTSICCSCNDGFGKAHELYPAMPWPLNR